uniref:Uncharacterized protein n=1 Tax=Leersia perrieri TaxID=77586 RepID=A0A0D9XJ67_9ORYZ
QSGIIISRCAAHFSFGIKKADKIRFLEKKTRENWETTKLPLPSSIFTSSLTFPLLPLTAAPSPLLSAPLHPSPTPPDLQREPDSSRAPPARRGRPPPLPGVPSRARPASWFWKGATRPTADLLPFGSNRRSCG